MDTGLIKAWTTTDKWGWVKRTSGQVCWAWFKADDCDVALQQTLAAKGSFGQEAQPVPVYIGDIEIHNPAWRARGLRLR